MSRISIAAILFWVAASISPTAFGQRIDRVQRNLPQLILTHSSTPYPVTGRTPLDERQHFAWTDGDWAFEGRTVYAYDRGDRLEEIYYDWNGLSNDPISRIGYSRNDLNLVVVNERWDTEMEMFVPDDLIDMQLVYDAAADVFVVAEETERIWSDNVWTNVERTVYALDGALNVTGWQTEIWGDTWVPYQRQAIQMANDSIVALIEGWDGASWINVERHSFPYATIEAFNDALRSFENETADFEAPLFALHLLPVFVSQNWDGFDWLNATRLVPHYEGGGGRRSHVEFEEWSGSEWVPISRLNHEYDTSGKLSGIAAEIPAGPGVWSTHMRETYAYDGADRIISITQMVDLGSGLHPTSRLDFFWSALPISIDKESVPTSFGLSPAYPNPFISSTRLVYELDEPVHVTLSAMDVLGRRVAILHDGMQPAGSHEATFDGAILSNGLYLIRLETPNGHAVRFATLQK